MTKRYHFGVRRRVLRRLAGIGPLRYDFGPVHDDRPYRDLTGIARLCCQVQLPGA